jgi:hypothetical protein
MPENNEYWEPTGEDMSCVLLDEETYFSDPWDRYRQYNINLITPECR